MFTPRDTRAIIYVGKRYDYNLSLRSYPYAYFYRKDDSQEVKMHITDILLIYDEGRRSDSKERAVAKKRKGRLSHHST